MGISVISMYDSSVIDLLWREIGSEMHQKVSFINDERETISYLQKKVDSADLSPLWLLYPLNVDSNYVLDKDSLREKKGVFVPNSDGSNDSVVLLYSMSVWVTNRNDFNRYLQVFKDFSEASHYAELDVPDESGCKHSVQFCIKQKKDVGIVGIRTGGEESEDEELYLKYVALDFLTEGCVLKTNSKDEMSNEPSIINLEMLTQENQIRLKTYYQALLDSQSSNK